MEKIEIGISENEMKLSNLFAAFCFPKMSKNISLFFPQIEASITKEDLVCLLQEKCHLGEIENIELFEELCVTSSSHYSAFVYFQSWYPTLGNQMIQEQLETTGQIKIPFGFDSDASSVYYLHAHKNYYTIPSYISSEEEETEEEQEGKKGDEIDEEEILKYIREQENIHDQETEEIMMSQEEQSDEINYERYYQEMEEAMELMGNESFDFVSSDYAACLETQISSMMNIITPISQQ